jgi:hypothetical protein
VKRKFDLYALSPSLPSICARGDPTHACIDVPNVITRTVGTHILTRSRRTRIRSHFYSLRKCPHRSSCSPDSITSILSFLFFTRAAIDQPSVLLPLKQQQLPQYCSTKISSNEPWWRKNDDLHFSSKRRADDKTSYSAVLSYSIVKYDTTILAILYWLY